MSGGSDGELAGALSERVTIERRDPARDALGGADGAWTTLAAAWAAIMPDGRGDAVSGDAWDARPRWRVVLRAGVDAGVGDRLVWGARTLRVRDRSDDPALPDRAVLACEEKR